MNVPGNHDARVVRCSGLLDEDPDAAIRILVPLLRERLPEAIGLLGSMYWLGRGRGVDASRARRLLSCAARRGDGLAAHNLGTLLCVGAPGVERDLVAAREAFLRAESLGCCPGWPPMSETLARESGESGER